MFLVRIKWIHYLLSGLILHLSVFLFCSWISYPLSLKSFFISIACLIVWIILSAILFNVGKSNNILWSPFALFQKRKFVYHNKLGYFLIFITPDTIDVMEVTWFGVREKISIRNNGNIKEIVKEMKEKLDEAFKSYLLQLKSLEKQKQNIKVIKDWDGLLIDTDERRDNKIDKILKK